MSNWQWATVFWQPASAIASTSATGYEPARVITLDQHPLQRSWRSLNLTPNHDVIVDLGVSRLVPLVAFLNINVTQLIVMYSTDALNYTPFTGSPFTVANDIDGFYKLCIVQSATWRYLLVRFPAQTPVTGAPYFELGMVVVVQTLRILATNPQPDLIETISRPYLRTSSDDVAPIGMNRTIIEMQLMAGLASSTQYPQIARFGQHTPVLLFKNAGLAQEVGLYRLTQDVTMRTGGTTMSINPSFRELV